MGAVVCSLAIVSVMACEPAWADVFDFSYTVYSGVTATGTLTANLQGGSTNTYDITALSGTRNGFAMTLLPAGTYDGNTNVLYFPAGGDNPEGTAYLDFYGFAYNTAEGNFQPYGCGALSCGGAPATYDEEHGTPGPTGSMTVTSFSMTLVPGPIPGSGALSYLIVLLGGAWRWREPMLARARQTARSALRWARLIYRPVRPSARAAPRAV